MQKHHAATERQRIVAVVVFVAVLVGLFTAAIVRVPVRQGGVGHSSDKAPINAGAMLSVEDPRGQFRHIVDDFDDDIKQRAAHAHRGTAANEDSLLSSVTLNDLRDELKRLQKPLRMLIHQLEPAATPAPQLLLPPDANGDVKHNNDEDAAAERDTVPPSQAAMYRLQYHPAVSRERTVFVTLVGFADPNKDTACTAMVDMIFDNAASREFITVGLVEIYDDAVNITALTPSAVGCVSRKYTQCNQSTFCATDHIRVRRLRRIQVQGLQSTLRLAMSMFRNERYTLITSLGSDGSYAALPSQWDTELLLQLKAVGASSAAQALLTSSGRAASEPTEEHRQACHIVVGGGDVNSTSLRVWDVRREPSSIVKQSAEVPLAHFSFLFGPSEFHMRVPLDTSVAAAPAALFDVAYSMRLAARGFRIFVLPTALQPVIANATDALHSGALLWSHLESSAQLATTAASPLRQLQAMALGQRAETGRRFRVSPASAVKFWIAAGLEPTAAAGLKSSGEAIDVDWCKNVKN